MAELPLSCVELAYEMVVRELRSCYDDFGIVAGRHHFDDYWTRDAFFGWLAALELGDDDVVGQHLATLAHFQRPDGAVPFLVRRHLAPASALGLKIRIPLRPKFRSHKALFLSEVIDSSPLFIIGLTRYLEKQGDEFVLDSFFSYLDRAWSWCLDRLGPDGLVREGRLAGWNDGILKSGRTLMSNVLFYQALTRWGQLSPAAARIRVGLQREFFNGRYFLDWIDDRGRHDYFDSNANLLAVLWGVADEAQTDQILDFVRTRLFDHPPLVQLVYPRYAIQLVEPTNRLAGVAGYCNGERYWTEPTSLYTLALEKVGRREEAATVLEGLSQLVLDHRGLHEIYEREDAGFRPARWPIYRAEHPFARGAGLFVLACRKLGME